MIRVKIVSCVVLWFYDQQATRRFEAVTDRASLCSLKRSTRATTMMQTNITTTILIAFSSVNSSNVLPWAMSNPVQIRVAADAGDGFDSPAKQKAANRSAYSIRPFLYLRRAKQFLGAAKFKLFLVLFALSVIVFVSSRLSSWMGWNPHHSSSVSSTSRYIKKIRSVFLCNFTFFFYLLLFTRCLFLGGLHFFNEINHFFTTNHV